MNAFKVEQGTRGLNVTCPNRHCRLKFIVPKKWLLGWTSPSGRLYRTASCPGCFKTARRGTV